MGGTIVQAAGGAVWRHANGTTEVAVVHRPRHRDWSLPKGKAIRGEHPLDTARREVREETGIHPVLGPRLPTQRYRSAAGDKVVRFWAMSGQDGDFTPTTEVDEAIWLPVPEARARLTHRRDIAVLDALAGATTVDAVVLLVRHAGTTGRRGAATPALDGPGQRQAQALRRLLPGFGPSRLLCADDRRRATLAPLATRLRLPVAYGQNLREACGRHRPTDDPHLIRDLAADAGTTVVAAPGWVVRDVLTALAGQDAVAVLPVRPRKGSVWALFFHRARLIGADYYSIKG
ncbi:NUDIX hydrolase [Paractinoplanes toevensis]|uniref:8-oxo-dGTP diphosphatase 1 n=1 Tax=Paractinoplanes toevensis TaxID=571911 RepID=A0A919WAS7_9ACTN|nr:NUDIX hydrolase [Actinoplanes toevensis]GIM96755.1 putative 8-oxo-dGTP diphosphatase 1 [Actinoplanes toevensis]